mgnify:CR=1 FL=1
MIIVDNIAEYETLSTIKNFCKNHNECKGCSNNFMCNFFNKDTIPEQWEIKLELKEEDSKETQDIDITEQIQEKISDKLFDEKYDHMIGNEIAQSIMKNSLKKQ